MKKKLNIVWKAKFSDNSIINQFDKNNKEQLFKKVLDKRDDLVLFELQHIKKPLRVIVDLRRGLIFINNQYEVADSLVKEKKNIRLIYFRRNRIITDIRGEIVNHNIVYFIGYQYNDKYNNNKKELLQIDQKGNIIVVNQ